MANITYLFGAGASKEALPVVQDLNIRMAAILAMLKQDLDNNAAGICDASVNPYLTRSSLKN